MPLSPRSSANFQDEAFDFIKQYEGTVLFVYGDGLGVPTIGHGYALVVQNASGT
jgi:GH24 family phage-related lysozyme (muramidase)